MFSRLFRSSVAAKTRRAARPSLEGLEDRNLMAVIHVVPIDQPVDASHRHTLADAMPFAGVNGTVVIEPGATGDAGTVNVTLDGLTITGNPSVPGASLARYTLNVNADNVTLKNLNLGDVTLSATGDHLTISRSLLVNYTETGAVTGTGFNTLDQNTVTGAVTLSGNSGAGLVTGTVVTHNTFQSVAPIILQMTNAIGSTVTDNTFVGDRVGQVGIQVHSNSYNLTLSNNHIELFGNDSIGMMLMNTGGALGNQLTAKVHNNTIETNNDGTALYCNIFGTGNLYVLQVQGNDFQNNLVGVDIYGVQGATGAGQIDLGNGSTLFGTSLGGNNFRGFTGQNGHYAIILRNTDANISVLAELNIYDAGVDPNTLVRDGNNAGGTGHVDVSIPLSPNNAFVQNLYRIYLGRTATAGEMTSWANLIPSIGQAGVANGIVRSTESLTRIVNEFYIEYLGRTGDAGGLASWVSQLQSGVSLTKVEAGFVASAEYLSHVNVDVVQALYINLLERPGAAIELAGWYNVMPQLGFQGVVEAFTNSTEHRNRIIADDFDALLNRIASASDLATFNSLAADPIALQIVLLSSPEFLQNG